MQFRNTKSNPCADILHTPWALDSQGAAVDHEVPKHRDEPKFCTDVNRGEVHDPPRYNARGTRLNPRKLSEIDRITKNSLLDQWTYVPKHTTREELEASRRASRLPDPSFDLDKDGSVTPREYFVAKYFDKDLDGKLNEQEHAECTQALQNNFCDKFTFSPTGVKIASQVDLDNRDQRWFKIEDGLKNALLKYGGSEKTRSQLLQQRKESNISKLEEGRARFASMHPPADELAKQSIRKLTKVKPQSEGKCLFRSQSEMLLAKKRQLRENIGLTRKNTAVNGQLAKMPHFYRVEEPTHRTRTQLQLERTADNIAHFENSWEQRVAEYISPERKRELRLEEEVKNLEQVVGHRTRNDMIHERKTNARMVGESIYDASRKRQQEKNAIKPFCREEYFWKPGKQTDRSLRRTVSHAALEQAKKSGKPIVSKDDPFDLPEDPFKKTIASTYKTRKAKSQLAPKIGSFVPSASLQKESVQAVKRFTSVIQNFKNPPPLATQEYDIRQYEPLYSSFSRDKVFRDPMLITRERKTAPTPLHRGARNLNTSQSAVVLPTYKSAKLDEDRPITVPCKVPAQPNQSMMQTIGKKKIYAQDNKYPCGVRAGGFSIQKFSEEE